jgi:hypothetical protein
VSNAPELKEIEMKIVRDARVKFDGEGLLGQEASFELRYGNMGEPYREGASARIESGDEALTVFLTEPELTELYDCLGRMLRVERR